MPDEFDRASDIEMAAAEEGIKHALTHLRPQYDQRFDGWHCVDCGEELAVIRITDKRVRCVGCQETLDQRARQWKRR